MNDGELKQVSLSLRNGRYSFRVAAAPLAGVTDAAYQKILSELSAPVIYTEMISSATVVRTRALPERYLYRENPGLTVCQMFGKSPELMADAAKVLVQSGAQAIDINMGCPARKIVKSGSGVALMKNPKHAASIIAAVRKAVRVPLGVKLRAGWSPREKNVLEIAGIAEREGVDFITVHGRFRGNYAQPADWTLIGDVVEKLHIPVIGNGDVFTVEDARNMMEQTGCHAVMAGRGILGNPWLPRQIHRYLQTGVTPAPIPLHEKINVMIRHLDALEELFGSKIAALVFRKHSAWYLKGIPNSARIRKRLFTLCSPREFKDFLETLQDAETDNPEL